MNEMHERMKLHEEENRKVKNVSRMKLGKRENTEKHQNTDNAQEN